MLTRVLIEGKTAMTEVVCLALEVFSLCKLD